MGLIIPEPLKRGDKIAIISPASVVREEFVEGAAERIAERGYVPVLMEHALGPSDGSYASEAGSRVLDLMNALEDPEIKAILCARGGYGCAGLLQKFPQGLVSANPKWIIGFSDISALLSMWYFSGVASVHGPMAKHLATSSMEDPCTQALFYILENGGGFNYNFPISYWSKPGMAHGRLIGGNLAVLNDLAATHFDLLDANCKEGFILFLEDVGEPIYAVERMLWRLELAGILKSAKGLIFGQFTEYKPDKNYNSMEEMISSFLEKSSVGDIPVAVDFPVGHTRINYPLTVGAEVSFSVSAESISLKTIF